RRAARRIAFLDDLDTLAERQRENERHFAFERATLLGDQGALAANPVLHGMQRQPIGVSRPLDAAVRGDPREGTPRSRARDPTELVPDLVGGRTTAGCAPRQIER